MPLVSKWLIFRTHTYTRGVTVHPLSRQGYNNLICVSMHLGLFCSCVSSQVCILVWNLLCIMYEHTLECANMCLALCMCLLCIPTRVATLFYFDEHENLSLKNVCGTDDFCLSTPLIFKEAHFFCRIYAGFMSLIHKAIKIVYRIMWVTEQLT